MRSAKSARPCSPAAERSDAMTASLPFEPPSLDTLRDLTVGGLLERRAREMPYRVALSAESARGFRERLCYAQLALYMRRVGAGLARQGVTPGDRVAVYLGNEAGREAVLTALGCLAIGAIVVPVNTRAGRAELCHALSLVRPSLAVTVSASAERLREAYPMPLMLIDAKSTGSDSRASAWPEPENETAECDTRRGSWDEPACLLYTSGTTSRSKAVVHTHRSMLHAGLAMGLALGIGPQDLYQGAFPFFTSSCLNLACMSCWVHGSGFALEGPLDNAARLRLIQSECTTMYHGVPSTIQFMLDETERGDYDLRRVRRIAYGGAAMPAATILRIARSWPWMEQVHVWGMTESGPAGAWLPPSRLPGKAGLIGCAMPHCELSVVDPAGQPVPRGEAGELRFRGPSMARGYFEDEAATEQAFRDGWLYTGDIVREDEDGLLCFIDRAKDVINRGGLKIASAAVESALLSLPGVAEAAVVAAAHPRLGEQVAAFIVAAPGALLEPAALAEGCRGNLADYEVPTRWEFVDALPRNPMGKVLKRELRERLA
jgi:acyl-CoA synthetase (AMP-forming)/AMP-acid ligase II